MKTDEIFIFRKLYWGMYNIQQGNITGNIAHAMLYFSI